MTNHNDQSNTRGSDRGLAQTMSTGRRRFLQAAGIGATGLTGFGGLAAGQSDGTANTISLEAVSISTGRNARGRSEYVWEDGEEGVVKGPPEAVCDFVGGNHVWMGVAPDSIADITNPTLSLTAGETYTVEWTNTDGEEHNFAIADAEGNELLVSDTLAEQGATQVVEFEATAEMATYYCGPHSGSQRGPISVESSGGGEDEWIQLFDGESLDGWTPKFMGESPGENYNDTFTVEDGALKASYDSYDGWDGTFGHLFYEDEFSHYVLRAEYRFVGEQPSGAPGWAFMNNGLMIHGQQPGEMETDQDFPDSIEVQLLGQSEDSDEARATANVCTPGTHIVMDGELHEQHCTRSDSDTYRGDQWVTVTIVVRGNEAIRHIVEDDGVVMSYSEPQLEDGTPLEGGTISIQSESHPTEFRTIELKEVDPDAPIGEELSDSAEEPMWSNYTKTQLADSLEEPMAIEVTPDHRVLFTTRGQPNGSNATARVGVVDPETTDITTALELDVYRSGEDGLQGLTLDPGFEENGWVYLYYSAPHEIIDEEPHKRLSRFTLDGDTIDPGSEVEILRVPAADNPDFHVGGDLEFGPDDNLFLSTGDDTSPFESSGYTPIDERDGRELFDAQRSASNTNDLRGSILRISPNDEGGYEIPDGNMFTGPEYADARNQGLVREEIYAMGCRNPFRMGVDEDGVVYWGDYGPDARSWDTERGPPGIVEFNRAEEPGFYGWPYVIGPNLPYIDGEFATEGGNRVFNSSGEPFDPENLVNESPNNTGLTELPEPKKSDIWYTYSWDALLTSPPDYATEYLPEEAPFPNFEGGAPMAGPIYQHQDSYGQGALPEQFFDGKQLIGEWGAQWLKYVSYEDDGTVKEIKPFMPGESFLSPMDMTIGPDGTLYLLEWGDGYASPISGQSGIYRIERAVGIDFEGIENDELTSGPGTTTTVNATVTNPFESTIESGEVTLGAPDDSSIEVTPVGGQTFDSLAQGQTQSVSWEVSVPEGTNGRHQLMATITYTGPGGEQSRTMPAFTVRVMVGQSLAGEWQFQTGDDSGWSDPSFDDSGWETAQLPNNWEDHSNYTDAQAFGWYRKTVTVPESWEGQNIRLQVGKIDDVDETFFNGTKVGQTGTFPENGYSTAWEATREYTVSAEDVNYGGENVIAIRVYDGDGLGGLYEGPLLLSPTSDGGGNTLQDGLEAHLPLDSDTPTNTVTDTDATIQGDVVTGEPGMVGNAYEVHTNQETGVEIPPSEATAGDGVITESLPLNGEGATAAAWINYTDHEQWGRAPFQIGGSLGDGPADGWNIQFESNTDTIRSELWDNGSPSNGSGGTPVPVDPDTWYFVVLVVNGVDTRLHVFDQDGELDASPQAWTGGSRSQTDAEPLVLGAGQGYDMAGRIDDVWAYSRALSEDEVGQLHSLSLEGDDGGDGEIDGTPAEWSSTTYGDGSAEHTYVSDVAADGDRSVSISSSDGADASWVQTVSLERNTEYTIRAQVKTETVQPVDGSGQADISGSPFGATISVGTIANATYPDVSGPIPDPLTGTNDWTTLETTFNSGDYDVNYDQVEVLALFGGYGQATGTAWYDDFALIDPDGTNLLSNASFETGSSASSDPTTIQLGGEISGWVGQAPSSIDGTTNPTLTLQAGETYRIEWENLDGSPHNLQILDHDDTQYEGHIVGGVDTSLLSTQGETQSVEFTATEEMVRYQCRPHRSSMHGDIEVNGSGQ